MNINVSFDSSTSGAPSAFFAAINAVAQYFDNLFTNPITVSITVGYGKIDGEALISGALGESETEFNQYSYSAIRGALISSASTVDQHTAANSLPAGDPTGGGNYWVSTAEAKAIGLSAPSASTDGFVGFASAGVAWTYNTSNGGSVASGTYDFFGVAAHEFTEVLGRDLFVGNQDNQGIGSNSYTPLDLFHYSSNGVRDFLGTTPGYFSLNGGKANLDNFNTNSSGDFGDWASSAGNDAFLAFSKSGVPNAVTASDVAEMAALGYDGTTPAPLPGNIGFTGNFAGNGFADIVWEDTTSGATTFWANSAGTIPSDSATFSVPPSWQIVGTGDFNGDGKSDVMWQNQDGTPGIWLMNGTTLTAAVTLSNPGAGWRIVGTGDFDASGRSGLVWQNGTALGVWLMNGTTVTAAVGLAGPGANWKVVGTGDFNNDGRDDILLQNSSTGNLTVDFMNGTSVTSSSTVAVGDPNWHVVATGRISGDEAIIWQNTNGTPALWLMNGTTPVSEAVLPNPGPSWQITAAGDFNHDGNSDLLFRNVAANQSSIWLMNGTQISVAEQPGAAMATAASTATPGSALSAAPVLYSSELLYSEASGVSAAPMGGTGSLGEQLPAAPVAGAGTLHLTQV
jgi:hypothetical protein